MYVYSMAQSGISANEVPECENIPEAAGRGYIFTLGDFIGTYSTMGPWNIIFIHSNNVKMHIER